jgi:hypothetical protein
MFRSDASLLYELANASLPRCHLGRRTPTHIRRATACAEALDPALRTLCDIFDREIWAEMTLPRVKPAGIDGWA